MPERFVLVLAGGRGERFWPWSRPERPKQLLPLARGGRSLLAATLDRALALASGSRILVLTARDLKQAVLGECAGTGVRVLSEPAPRNTAAAIGAAAALFHTHSADPVFAVLPADHAIDDTRGFVADLERAFDLAEREPALITFGIRPAGPETNFGYMLRGERRGEGVYRVARFTEKPDRARAAEWVAGGQHMWNSGVFVWRCSTFFAALGTSRPDLAEPLKKLRWRGSDDDFEGQLDAVFPGLDSISVDYAVLERAPNALMLEASFDWDDLGSWSAWGRRQQHDERGNVLFGDALALDCDRCIVVGEGGTAAAMGLNDMVVVHAGGATLSCRLEDSNHVRRVSEAVRARAAR
jgi:mannose-1-phosphate guanylyltransferase